MPADESVIINTLLAGVREFVAGAREEAVAMHGMGTEAEAMGLKMQTAGRRGIIASQAMFTVRRAMFAGTLAIVAAGAAVVKLGWNYTSAMQQAKVAMTGVFPTTRALNKELNTLFRFSAFTPFQFKDITIAFRQLYASLQGAPGITNPLKIANKTLKSLTDALAYSGKTSPQQLQRMSLAIQHMAYQGHLTGYAVNQLSRDGLPMLRILNKELGLTGAQIHEISSMNVPVQTVLNAINHFMATTPGFKDAAFKQATKTLHGAWTTFKDLLSQAAGTSLGGSNGGLFGGIQKFLTDVDKNLKPFYSSNKPMTLLNFAAAIDQVLTPKSHGFLMLFKQLRDLLINFKDVFMDIVSTIGKSKLIWGILYVGLVLLNKIMGVIVHTSWLWEPVLVLIVGYLLLNKTYAFAATGAMIAYRAALMGVFVASKLVAIWQARAAGASLLAAAGIGKGLWATKEISTFSKEGGWAISGPKRMTVFTNTSPLAKGIRAMASGLKALPRLFMAAAAASWEFAIALLANPITWIVLAVLALTVGLVILYYKWKAFHDLVDVTFNWIKHHWLLLGTIIFGPIYMIGAYLYASFGAIKGFVGAICDWIANKIDWVGKKLTALWNKVPGHGFLGKAAGWAASAGGAALNPFGWAASQMPAFANGGTMASTGLALVGEHGPEVVTLPTGAHVTKSGQFNFADFMGGFTVTVMPQAVMLDGQKIGEVTAEVVISKQARS